MLRITSNEKAFMGGLLAFLSATIIQMQQSGGGYTLQNFEYSIAAWAAVHLGVYLTTNTPKPVTPAPTPLITPTVVPIDTPPTNPVS